MEKLSGQKITLMRPPHGFRDWAVIDTLQKNGLTAVNWSVIPRDWTNPGVSVIVDRIIEQMHPGLSFCCMMVTVLNTLRPEKKQYRQYQSLSTNCVRKGIILLPSMN